VKLKKLKNAPPFFKEKKKGKELSVSQDLIKFAKNGHHFPE
jgi:hypothetical protein